MAIKRTSTKPRAKRVVREDDFEFTPKIVKDVENRLNRVDLNPKTVVKQILPEFSKLKYRNGRQKEFLKIIDDNEIIMCIGPAGCGKSFLSVYKAFQLLLDPKNNYHKIVISTPAVEADEKLGFLPGDKDSKLDPYIFSTFYLMEKLIGEEALKSLKDKKIITVMPFAFMRGINIDNTILLGEELQNTTPRQMKTLLSRIGEDSKFILSGDYTQSDRFKDPELTGLWDAYHKMVNLLGVGTYQFGLDDVVRNPLVGKMLAIYEEADKLAKLNKVEKNKKKE